MILLNLMHHPVQVETESYGDHDEPTTDLVSLSREVVTGSYQDECPLEDESSVENLGGEVEVKECLSFVVAPPEVARVCFIDQS